MSAVLDAAPAALGYDDLPAADTLRTRFAEARQNGLRARDAARSIGVPEGAAIEAHTGLHGQALHAVPLRGPWVELLQGLQACGPLMALTRNHSTVHERTGVYENVSAGAGGGIALGPDIDLRLFFGRWHAGYAVTEAPRTVGGTPTRSLQFFDAHGEAVHKIYVREATDLAAFDALVQRFGDPGARRSFGAPPPPPAVKSDAEIDAAGLRAAWAGMQDTHAFFGLLRQFGAERQQALRLAQGSFTERVAPTAVAQVLHAAAASQLPIMVFVGSAGCIQIHTGPVQRIVPMEREGVAWINVLDPSFNLHLRTDQIATAWVVRKPTADGDVTSLEAFDHQGELMAMFFGARKPGAAELPGWRALVAALPREQAP